MTTDVDPAGTAAVITAVLHGHPDIAEALDATHRASWAAVDHRLLELCRIRVAQLLGCDEEADARTPGVAVTADELASVSAWPTSPCFDATDRAVLAWCEQFVIDVAAMDDSTVTPVRDHLGDGGLIDLTNALLVIEQRQRLRMAWSRLFGVRTGA